MIESTLPKKRVTNRKIPQKLNGNNSNRYKRLACMGKISMRIMNEISRPIDAVNRFINLTLQTIDENSQGREFLLESKAAIRKTSVLLKRLNIYAKRIEKEIREISANGR